MMTDCVPDFNEMEDDYEIPTSSRFTRPKKPAPGEEDVMELMWQNGQVVVQKSYKKNSFGGGGGEAVNVADQAAAREIRLNVEEQQPQHLFMQEDEMASWLQYPMDDSFDRNFYSDLLYSAPPPPPPITTAAPPSIPLRPEIAQRAQNFMHFSRLPSRPTIEAIPKPSVPTVRETTVVESNVTPAMMPESRVSHTVAELNTETETSAAAGEFARKRKATDAADDNESHSEEIEFETTEAKKQAPGSSSAKRSRAAEVHNLSERRRRDRINEKMKALQELIPRCNKSDKASMLDEAIEYLKSLQMQVQMMSMGYGMVPMMYPGMQQYIPAMGMGMGMNRPIVPYPSVMPGSGVPNPAAAAHVGPRFPMPAFHLPPVGLLDPSRTQATNQTDPMLNRFVSHNPNQQQMPNFVDPYQQFLHLQQAQMSLQNQTVVQPRANNPSTSKNVGNPEHQQTG